MLKVYAASCIEKYICSWAHYWVFFCALEYFVIIELVPFASILCHRCIVPSWKLSCVIWDSEQIIDRSMWWLVSRDYKLRHVKTIFWEIYQCILLWLIATEPFEIDDQYRWYIIDLNLFDSLLMVNASVTVPCISLWKFLGSVELSKTVINAHAFCYLVGCVVYI